MDSFRDCLATVESIRQRTITRSNTFTDSGAESLAIKRSGHIRNVFVTDLIVLLRSFPRDRSTEKREKKKRQEKRKSKKGERRKKKKKKKDPFDEEGPPETDYYRRLFDSASQPRFVAKAASNLDA